MIYPKMKTRRWNYQKGSISFSICVCCPALRE